MDVLSAIKTRRSIRKYSSKPIEDEKIQKLLEAVRFSPSACNKQDWKFIVVKDKDQIAKLKDAAEQEFVGNANIVMVACGTDPDKVMACGQHTYTVDVCIAMSYMMLEVHELGLGACWLGHFNENKVKEALGIPSNIRVVAIAPVGYPAENPSERGRKEINEISSFDRY